ncbi:hypothetical protein HELRODRAFT_182099 [Helobdella robusta]|uniref:Uncharacterized protein n=1 Tax=Helobdella robusta TaxID=6412 RepID=T1FHR0_HELRO|nr:hypothetical protein HELRODRAFT_182099 [Helobdella robusta]ESN91243.1 hypothetical protein HELRODRAFT_182099 [Helobdella robusta]
MTKLHQLKLVQQQKSYKKNFATSGKRGDKLLIKFDLTKALVNENEKPDKIEFDNQDVESNAVVNAGASTKLMTLLRTILTEIKPTREQIDKFVKAEQQSAVINAKIKQKFDQKFIELDKKLSCKMDKFKQNLEKTNNVNSTPKRNCIGNAQDSDLRQTLILADKRNFKDKVLHSKQKDQDYCQNAEIIEKKDIYDEIVNTALETITVVIVQQHGTND